MSQCPRPPVSVWTAGSCGSLRSVRKFLLSFFKPAGLSLWLVPHWGTLCSGTSSSRILFLFSNPVFRCLTTLEKCLFPVLKLDICLCWTMISLSIFLSPALWFMFLQELDFFDGLWNTSHLRLQGLFLLARFHRTFRKELKNLNGTKNNGNRNISNLEKLLGRFHPESSNVKRRKTSSHFLNKVKSSLPSDVGNVGGSLEPSFGFSSVISRKKSWQSLKWRN